MSKQLFKASLDGLKTNEPYRLKGKKPSFQAPKKEPPPESVSDSKESKPVVEGTTGETNHRLEVRRVGGDKHLKKGFLKLPHELNEWIVRSARTKNEMQILSCLVRYTLGFQQSECEASLGYISKWTGIKDKSNISKAMRRLMDRGLIERVSDYDSKRVQAARYRVPMVEPHLSSPVVKQTTGRRNHWSKAPSTSGTNDHKPMVDQTTNKEIPPNKLQKSEQVKERREMYQALKQAYPKKKEREAIIAQLLESMPYSRYGPNAVSRDLAVEAWFIQWKNNE